MHVFNFLSILFVLLTHANCFFNYLNVNEQYQKLGLKFKMDIAKSERIVSILQQNRLTFWLKFTNFHNLNGQNKCIIKTSVVL